MLINTRLQRIVAGVTLPFFFHFIVLAGFWTAITAPPLAIADEMRNSAQEGRSLANGLWGRSQGVPDGNGDATITYSDGGSENMSRTDMIPGSAGDWSSWENTYGDDGAIESEANSNRDSARSAEGSGSENDQQAAFNSVSKGNDRSHPDMRDDPMWNNSDAMYRSLETRENNCDAAGSENITTQQCHRDNSLQRCDLRREVYTVPISKSYRIFEWDGCMDHTYLSFKVKVDNSSEKEMRGYFVDFRDGTRYDMDDNKRFTTVPDHLWRGQAGIDSKEYHYLEKYLNGQPQGRYGVTRQDIQQQYPELEYNLWSMRDSGEDIGAAARVYFNPIDDSDFMDDPNDQVVVQEINVSASMTTDMTAPGSTGLWVDQMPSSSNGWIVRIAMDDNGTGAEPTCPTYSIYGNPENGYGGSNGTAWGRIKLDAHITGYVIKERVIEGPEGCRANAPSQCVDDFYCTDNAPRDYGSRSEDDIRQYLNPMFQGDDPKDTSRPVCYAASMDKNCLSKASGYDSSKSCKPLEEDKTCQFKKTVKCGETDSTGRCLYYVDEFTCGHNWDAQEQCELRNEMMETYPGCSEETTTSSTSESTFLEDPRSCEIIHELTSCRLERTINGDDDSVQHYPAEPDNYPCLKQDDGKTAVSWQCTDDIRPPGPNPPPSPYDPLYPGDDGYCTEATATYDTYFWRQSAGCYVDAYSDTQCPQADDDNVDKNTCDDLEAQGCSWKGVRRCVDNSQSPYNGFCYLEELEYECGEEVEREVKTTERSYDCGTGVRCMGNDCWDSDQDPSAADDFGKAASAMQLAEFIASDGVCDANGNCTFFEGDDYYCKKAMGGVQNCCDNPGGPGMSEYISLLLAAQKGRAAIANIEAVQAAGEAVAGAWNSIKEPVAKVWEDISQRFFTSSVESITAESGTAAAGSSFTTSMANFVGDVFGDAVKDALFSTAADGSTQFGGGAAWAGTAMNFMMTAYMYYAIAVMLIQIVWKCEEFEFEYASKRDLRVCHKVGSYCADKVLGACVEKREVACCFSSPLPRILNEQIRPQFNIPWGSPKYPDCRGITLGQLENVDWSRVDLSEWIAILSQTGNMPSGDVEERYSMENVTGNGNRLSQGKDRDNVQERSTHRNDVDEDQTRREVESDMRGQE